MGFWDFLKPSPSNVGGAWMSPRVEYLGGDEFAERLYAEATGVRSLSAAQMWRTQPHLRTVVSFVARNVAQLGLHVFERVSETDRRRDRTSPLARALLAPDVDMTTYELVFALVGDKLLHDKAYWLLGTAPNGAPRIRRLPATWVRELRDNPFEVRAYRVTAPNGRYTDVDPGQILAFPGYSPTSPHGCSPTIEALKETLAEQVEAAKYRGQVWKRGGRVSAVLKRPPNAPEWSDAARERFRDDWYAKYTGDGSQAGGTPILEDGMELERMDFSAKDQEYVDAAKLSFATVASAFHVNPTMVGILDNANYSNVREFRRMLYGDSLGPLIAEIEGRINAFLLPALGMDPAVFYAEFNIAEKLQGSFEEQAAVMSTMVGRPLMTADEGRAKFNLPALGGDADQLVTPLNVLVGGQASPRDTGTQNETPKADQALTKADRPALKAPAPDTHRAKVAEVLAAFFERQGKSVLSRIGTTSDWWDAQRWDSELTKDLTAVAHTLATTLGTAEAERLGYSDGYNADRTVAFLSAVAERYAGNINATTKSHLEAAIKDGTPPADVFTEAKDVRAPGVAVGVSTFVAGFATTEAARQIAEVHDVSPTKTWITGPNARPTHAAMSGETVPIDQPFSNGLQWPGESGDVDEVAGCNCSVQIEF